MEPRYPVHLEKDYVNFIKRYFDNLYGKYPEKVLKGLIDKFEDVNQGIVFSAQEREIFDQNLKQLEAEYIQWSEKSLSKKGYAFSTIERTLKQFDKWSFSQLEKSIKLNKNLKLVKEIGFLKKGSSLTEDLLQNAVTNNVDLIGKITEQNKDDINRIIRNGINEGKSTKILTKELIDATGKSKRKAQQWAKDQVAKTTGEMDRVRQIDIGIPGYIWRTVKDGRVRESHAVHEGKFYEWSKGAYISDRDDYMHPREDYGCRCSAQAAMGKEDQDSDTKIKMSQARIKRLRKKIENQ
jgi:SPP1 gp7 family putative phage head morphogenesis protein